jgi:pimeloyl-ACP methyl ester carboxylesterase
MPHKAEIYFFVNKGGDGEKPPVVFIHGAGGTHLNWPPQIRRLTGHRVYALDLPGHGKSGGRSQQSIAGYTRAVMTWFEQVGLDQAVFVGHSMGSAVVMELALTYPQHIVGLGLIGSGARLRVHPDLIQETASETTFHRAVDTVVNWSFSSHAPERMVELAAKRMSEIRFSVLHNDFLACDSFDVIDRVSEINQPTIIICGEDDCMTPIRFSRYLMDKIKGARLEIISQAGHMVMLEKPEPVADMLTGFLDGILSTKRKYGG